MSDLSGIYLFSMIVMRLGGLVSINPIFGRTNIPPMVKSGFVLVLSLVVYTFTGKGAAVAGPFTMLSYGILLVREVFVGIVLGFVFNLFFAIVQYVGTVIDFSMGLSMATAYDPQSHVSATINANLFYLFMMALFFTSNCHLVFLELILRTGNTIPYGNLTIPAQLAVPMLDLFKSCMEMALRMAFPMLAIQLLSEVGVGILMKMIPQIDVFVINIQLKIGIGMLFMLLMISPYGEFIENLLRQMMEQLSMALQYMK